MIQRLPRWSAAVVGVVVALGLSGLMSLAAASDTTPLSGTTWELSGWNSPDPIDTITGQPITLEVESGQVSGFAGCNRYFGPVDLGPSMIALGPNLATTMMACADPVARSESSYLALLVSADGWALSGNQLTLSAGGQMVLTFTRV